MNSTNLSKWGLAGTHPKKCSLKNDPILILQPVLDFSFRTIDDKKIQWYKNQNIESRGSVNNFLKSF